MRNIMKVVVAVWFIVLSAGNIFADETDMCIAEETDKPVDSVEGIILASNGLYEPCQIDRDCSDGLICTQVSFHRECRFSGGCQGLYEPCRDDRDCSSGLICTQVDSHRECRFSP